MEIRRDIDNLRNQLLSVKAAREKELKAGASKNNVSNNDDAVDNVSDNGDTVDYVSDNNDAVDNVSDYNDAANNASDNGYESENISENENSENDSDNDNESNTSKLMKSNSEAVEEYDEDVGSSRDSKGGDASIDGLLESPVGESDSQFTPGSSPMSLYYPRSISTSRSTINIESSPDNSLPNSRPPTPSDEERSAQKAPPSSEESPQPFSAHPLAVTGDLEEIRISDSE